jgi:tetratricopeptide (TPR) repeat protein
MMPEDKPASGNIDISDIEADEVNIGPIVTGQVEGDVVSGDQVAGDKVLGDKTTTIQTIIQNVPRSFLLVAGLALVLLIGLGLTTLPPIQDALFGPAGPLKMDHPFNVAVAYFGEQDASGQVSESENGAVLSTWVYETLIAEFDSLPQEIKNDYKPLVWHDSLTDPLVKGVDIGTVLGDTPEARQDAVEQLAREIGAHMVIYGTLVETEGHSDVALEFYVAPLEGEAEEIVGTQQLGAPVTLPLAIDLDDWRLRGHLNEKLSTRTQALSRFTIGLMYDLSGAPEAALEIFKQTETDLLEDWAEQGEGKEILYHFIGREALTLGSAQLVGPEAAYETVEAALDEAETYFKKAIESNTGYARAHIGLAGVYTQRVQRLPRAERLVAVPDIDRAIDEYETALALADEFRWPGVPIELEARFGLGTAIRLKGLAYRDAGFPDEAEVYFSSAGQEIEMILEPLAAANQERTLAAAYLALGVIYSEHAQLKQAQEDVAGSLSLFDRAEKAFDSCLELANPLDKFLQEEIVKRCELSQQQIDEARLALGGEK